MANPTKKDPHWKLNVEILREISKTAPIYNSISEEFVEVCLAEQLAIRAKELRIPVRKAYVKKGIYLDIHALGNTLNIPLYGSLGDVFSNAIGISDTINYIKNGNDEEKIYLESVYFYLIKLKSIDEGLYNDIVRKMDKRSKKWRIFQNYTHSGAQQLLK